MITACFYDLFTAILPRNYNTKETDVLGFHNSTFKHPINHPRVPYLACFIFLFCPLSAIQPIFVTVPTDIHNRNHIN